MGHREGAAEELYLRQAERELLLRSVRGGQSSSEPRKRLLDGGRPCEQRLSHRGSITL